MGKLRLLLSLITEDNDYQLEQAASAKVAASEHDVDLEIVFAGNDAITQSTQLLKVIQAAPALRPSGIIVEPLGATPLPRVASAAVAASIGWAVINREADYLSDLRRTSSVPVFSVTINQQEIGRIQGRQIARLVPNGGSVLFIQGPSVSSVSKERYDGLVATLPKNIQLVNLKGKWTQDSAYESVSSWAKLMRAQKIRVDLIAAQNDAMAMGAKRALKEFARDLETDPFSGIPATGCDGVPRTGQAWVRAGQLTSTIILPPCAGKAVAMMTRALRMRTPVDERTFAIPEAFPR